MCKMGCQKGAPRETADEPFPTTSDEVPTNSEKRRQNPDKFPTLCFVGKRNSSENFRQILAIPLRPVFGGPPDTLIDKVRGQPPLPEEEQYVKSVEQNRIISLRLERESLDVGHVHLDMICVDITSYSHAWVSCLLQGHKSVVLHHWHLAAGDDEEPNLGRLHWLPTLLS